MLRGQIRRGQIRRGQMLRGRMVSSAVALALAAVVLASCGSVSRSTSGASTGSTTPRLSQTPAGAVAGETANVAYAGSLQLLNDKVIGPAFAHAFKARYRGRGGGSIGLSHEIAAGEINPNVFESVGSGPIRSLEPKFTRWYVRLAASPIVVVYSPKSRYAPELAAIAKGTRPLKDLFALMAKPGFLLGRTNPDTDPQGQAFYEMLELAQSYFHLAPGTAHKVLGAVDNPSQVFAETALDSRLQAGQLDAASAFLSQAVQLHLPYISLPSAINFGSPARAKQYAKAGVTLSNGKTVRGVPLVIYATTIGRAPSAAAGAFIAYTLSPSGRAAFASGGYKLLPPRLYGSGGAVPSPVRGALAG